MTGDTMLSMFITWQFAAVCIAINALMTVFKRMGRSYAPLGTLQAKGWFKAFVMTPGNLVLGLGFGLIPGFLQAKDMSGNLVLGLVAGTISQLIYTVFKKRIEKEFGVTVPEEASDPAIVIPPAK